MVLKETNLGVVRAFFGPKRYLLRRGWLGYQPLVQERSPRQKTRLEKPMEIEPKNGKESVFILEL